MDEIVSEIKEAIDKAYRGIDYLDHDAAHPSVKEALRKVHSLAMCVKDWQ